MSHLMKHKSLTIDEYNEVQRAYIGSRVELTSKTWIWARVIDKTIIYEYERCDRATGEKTIYYTVGDIECRQLKHVVRLLNENYGTSEI